MDLTYRNDLRALNDTNFARFEAVLEARFAQLESRWATRLRDALAELEARLEAGLEAKLDARLGARLQPIESRFAGIDERFTQLGERLARLEDQLIGAHKDFHDALGQHMRWMIGLWMTTTIGILAVLVTLLRQGP